jgi:hypothetical protein
LISRRVGNSGLFVFFGHDFFSLGDVHTAPQLLRCSMNLDQRRPPVKQNILGDFNGD